MGIIGIGIDLLDSHRLDRLYGKFPEKLLNRILSSEEREEFHSKFIDEQSNGGVSVIRENRKINYLAKHFSAKESLLKALGIGLGRGIKLSDITVRHDARGKPIFTFSEEAKDTLSILYGTVEKLRFDLSMADEGYLVNSITIISGKDDE